MNTRSGEQGSESALRSSLGYLFQSYTDENSNNKETVAIAYNRAIEIVNETFSGLGDKKLVKNDIDKIKQMQRIIETLVNSEHPEVKYMGKSLAALLGELII